MPIVNLSRGTTAVSVKRSEVLPGQVFVVKTRDGVNRTMYACIGHNGRMYSINTASGELSSSDNEDSAVNILGTFVYRINSNPTPAVERDCRRSEVNSGEVFTVRGKTRSYLHMGRITLDRQGWLSVPVDNTENHAIGENGNGNVHVTGTFTVEVTLAK